MASKIGDCYRAKDCRSVVSTCQQCKRCSVQEGKEQRTNVVLQGCLCVCVQGVSCSESVHILYHRGGICSGLKRYVVYL